MISFYIPDRKLQDLKMNMRLIVFLVVASLFVSMGKFNSLSFFCGRILKQMGGGRLSFKALFFSMCIHVKVGKETWVGQICDVIC